MIGDVKMQMIKRRTGRSLTGDRPLFLVLSSPDCPVYRQGRNKLMIHVHDQQIEKICSLTLKKRLF